MLRGYVLLINYICFCSFVIGLKLWGSFSEYTYKNIHIFFPHRSRVTHIAVSKLTLIGSDNGLSPGRRQAIIWTNAGILSIRTFGTIFNEIIIKIHKFPFEEMHLKIPSEKCRQFCPGRNVSAFVYVLLWWKWCNLGLFRRFCRNNPRLHHFHCNNQYI